MPDDNTPTYRAFLLRYWREQAAAPDREPVWRLSLMDVAGEQLEYEFASLAELVDFLRVILMADQPDSADSQNPSSGETAEGPTI